MGLLLLKDALVVRSITVDYGTLWTDRASRRSIAEKGAGSSFRGVNDPRCHPRAVRAARRPAERPVCRRVFGRAEDRGPTSGERPADSCASTQGPKPEVCQSIFGPKRVR